MLRTKRDKIKDTIAAYEKKLREAQADLAHVNATLRLFAATGEPEDFPRDDEILSRSLGA